MDKEPKASELITLKEAAEYSGFAYGYLLQLARRGRLKARKLGMQWFTTRKDIEDYIASRQKRGRYRNDIGA
jgi:excisionase family DNA binding protein